MKHNVCPKCNKSSMKLESNKIICMAKIFGKYKRGCGYSKILKERKESVKDE